MKRIIKLRERDAIPDGAVFLHSVTEKEYSHTEYGTDWVLFQTQYIYYKNVTYFYYQIED
jgi:hypothetical protein